MNRCKLLGSWMLIAGFISCNQASTVVEKKDILDQSTPEFKDALIKQNRQLIVEEMELIDAYAERRGWELDTTSTGLRYKILERTQGTEVRLMKDVSLSYTASLLDGSVCYSSDSSGLLIFTVGQSNQPSGLQEGVLKMKEGEKAVFIVPSYLAYGISGDGICVPGSSSMVYQVKLEKVSKQ